MFHQQEFIFNSPNVRTRPASFARQTLLSIYHQTALLCYLFKRKKTVTFADISNSPEELLTHQSQQRKVFPTALLQCKSDDITLSEIINGVRTADLAT